MANAAEVKAIKVTSPFDHAGVAMVRSSRFKSHPSPDRLRGFSKLSLHGHY
jgi:hypothetical protein